MGHKISATEEKDKQLMQQKFQKQQETFDVIVINTGAAISKIWTSSRGDGMDIENALKPFLCSDHIITKAATT